MKEIIKSSLSDSFQRDIWWLCLGVVIGTLIFGIVGMISGYYIPFKILLFLSSLFAAAVISIATSKWIIDKLCKRLGIEK